MKFLCILCPIRVYASPPYLIGRLLASVYLVITLILQFT